MTTRTACESCVAAMINGVYCHELGCPDAWQDYGNECQWCGSDFQMACSRDSFIASLGPENRFQECCDDECCEDECHAAYSGW